jgi:hypothetical protein
VRRSGQKTEECGWQPVQGRANGPGVCVRTSQMLAMTFDFVTKYEYSWKASASRCAAVGGCRIGRSCRLKKPRILAVWKRISIEGKQRQASEGKDFPPRTKETRFALVVPKSRECSQAVGAAIPSQAVHRSALVRPIRPGHPRGPGALGALAEGVRSISSEPLTHVAAAGGRDRANGQAARSPVGSSSSGGY